MSGSLDTAASGVKSLGDNSAEAATKVAALAKDLGEVIRDAPTALGFLRTLQAELQKTITLFERLDRISSKAGGGGASISTAAEAAAE